MLNYSLVSTLVICTSFLLQGGCATVQSGSGSKYGSSTQGVNPNIQEGDHIKTGMSKEDVQQALGEPHINPFYPDTWTYVHTEHGKKVGKTITIQFVDDEVSHISYT